MFGFCFGWVVVSFWVGRLPIPRRAGGFIDGQRGVRLSGMGEYLEYQGVGKKGKRWAGLVTVGQVLPIVVMVLVGMVSCFGSMLAVAIVGKPFIEGGDGEMVKVVARVMLVVMGVMTAPVGVAAGVWASKLERSESRKGWRAIGGWIGWVVLSVWVVVEVGLWWVVL